MNTSNTFLGIQEQQVSTIQVNWKEIYKTIKVLAKRIVYAYRVPAWIGQENDIAEDITQEVARRLFEYEQKTIRNEVSPIHALLPMVRVITYNYVKDMRRRDMRIIHIEVQSDDIEQQRIPDDVIDAEECATENAFHDMLFCEMAQEIAHFPSKQKQALLIDLADHMSFEQEPTPLQQAFLKAGIQLQEYKNRVPRTPGERNRYTSLLTHAYKRIATLERVQTHFLA